MFVCVLFFCQNYSKHHSLHGEVGIFFHFPIKFFRDPERQNAPESQPQIRRQICFTLFYVSSRDSGLRF